MKIKLILTALAATAGFYGTSNAQLIVTGVFDGPLTGGKPKVVEIYAETAIADLSTFNVQYFFNASATPSTTTTLSGSAAAGDFFYLTPDASEFTTYFGGTSDFSGGSINGNDSIVVRNGTTVLDTFGVPGTDGSGEAWDYLDGWAYRNDNTVAGGATMNLASWTFSGINVNDSQTSNATAATPFPIGTYTVPEPSAYAMLAGMFALASVMLRRRG